jgi:anti-anti-sigma factor
MAFNASYKMVNGVAQVTLVGEADAAAGPAFRAEIEKAIAAKARSVALLVENLDYLSSAGLRVLVFTRQRLGAQVKLYMIGAQESVRETLMMTGLHHAVILLDKYDAAQIEKV